MKKSQAGDRLAFKEYLTAVGRVLKISFSIAPSAIFVKLLGGVLDSILPIITAYLAGRTITEITAAFGGSEESRSLALLFVGLTAFFGLLSALQSTYSNYLDQVLRFKVEAKISDMLYERFIQLDFWRYEDKTTTDLYDKAQDFTNFFAYVFDRIMGIFTSLFGIGSAVAALFFVSPWLAILFFVALLPNIVIQYKISRFNIEHWRKNVTIRRKQYFVEHNMIQPKIISELRLYNLAQKMLQLRVSYRNKDQGDRLQFERGFIRWRILGDAAAAAAQLIALVWVVIRIAERSLPIGQFVYVQQLVARALSSSNNFVREYGSIDEDLAKLKDYNDFMQLPLRTAANKRIREFESLSFENVSFHYPGSEKLVLKNVSFKINRSDHVALVGENGAGKSTLIKLLLGFYEPTEGRILVNGRDLSQYDIASWHRCVGVLLQNFTTFNFLTAGENVTFGDVTKKPTKERINVALKAAEALDVVKGLPKKLDTPLAPWMEEEGATDLSGGQWQRLGLARNFYREAPVVILDEPTSAIDALAEAKIFDRLFDKKNKKTLIAISHRLTTIESADQIYVIDQGSIVQKGTHTELAAQKSGQYATMFRRQLKNN